MLGGCGREVFAHQARVHQTDPLSCEEARETRIFDEYSDLDVSFLAALREVGARDESACAVDDDALRVQAAKWWPWRQCALVVVEVRAWIAERPVVDEKAAEVSTQVRGRIRPRRNLRHVNEEA